MNSVREHLLNLVRIASVSSLSNRPIIEYAIDSLHKASWRTRQIAYRDAAGVEKINLIAAPPGQNPEDAIAELAFLCHTDTVPYSPDWSRATAPFIDNGLLYGCGACDVKGFLACLLTAIGEAPTSALMDGLRVVLTADEEIGCVGAGQLVAADAIRPRRVVVGEPTSLRPARAGKGYCLAHVTVFGEEAHSALPQEGKSAIYRAARLITALEEFGLQLAEERHALFSPPFTTLNIGTIRGGTAKNIIPGRCEFQLEWRPIPGRSTDSIVVAIGEILERLRADDPGFRCELDVVRNQRGFETPTDSQLVRSLEALTARAATSIPFGSEASLLADIAEEAVVFGPGNMQTAHSSRECAPLSELDEACVILKSLMTGKNENVVPLGG